MKNAVLIGVLLLMPLCAQANDDAKRAKIERILQVTKVESMVDNMYAQVDAALVGMAQELGIQASEQVVFDRYMSKVAAAMAEQMTWAKIKEPTIDIYMKHYSEKEIDDMLVFYSSDSGKAIIEKMPKVMEESLLLSQSMLRDFMPKMKQLSLELSQELEAQRGEP